jgi:xanthine dehydrogenase YagR molybdenum-binding subunit
MVVSRWRSLSPVSQVATAWRARDNAGNALGVKGLGEVVQVGVAAAIGNAVFNATGRRVRQLPISAETLL